MTEYGGFRGEDQEFREPGFGETIGHLLNHPRLTPDQEYIIFSVGQGDFTDDAGSPIFLARNEIPVRDARIHPLFPTFLAGFSDDDRQRSQELLSVSGTLSEYLLLHYQQRVLKLAQEYKNKGVGQAELFQEGNIGLSRAIEKYDHEKISPHTGEPVRFSTFSTMVIRNSMADAVRRRWRGSGLPQHIAVANKIYRTVLDNLELRFNRQPTSDEIREEFRLMDTVSPKIVEFLLSGNSSPELTVSLNRKILLGDDGDEVELVDLLPSADNTEEAALTNIAETGLLSDLLLMIPEQYQKYAEILITHYGLGGQKKMSLRQQALLQGVTPETMRQREWKVIEAIRQALKAQQQGEQFEHLDHDFTFKSHFRDPDRVERRTKRVALLLKQGYTRKEISLLTGENEGAVGYAAQILYKRGEIPRPETSQVRHEREIKLANELIAKGKTPVEVAMKINKSVSTVKTNIRRAKQLLKQNPEAFESISTQTHASQRPNEE
jgi:RNA polymerase sigma factor (sigma-70 family)